ncbi:MAG TPA: antibiotic biosynthesis monooxygenase [Gammaproteobacteria bacterium]|nr:antibiotic biosynthesis monooxygenase [Gammaproteobacteria bacterium]|tara:strand:+ start:1676 stop:1978 length:303 start_codon:yes stop_codon:yes gene_type:complete
MIVVLFEFEPDPSYEGRYFELAGILRENVEQIEGFISVERFESVSDRERFISVSTWQNLDAVKRWREHLEHIAAQNEAKDQGIFRNYRIRVAEVIRDYGI